MEPMGEGKKWSRRERNMVQETLLNQVDHNVSSLVDNFRLILSSSTVTLTTDEEVRPVGADKSDLRISIATQNLISAGESIFRLTHEMDKMGVVNNTKERDAQVVKRHDALLKKKGDIEKELTGLHHHMSETLALLEASYYSSSYK